MKLQTVTISIGRMNLALLFVSAIAAIGVSAAEPQDSGLRSNSMASSYFSSDTRRCGPITKDQLENMDIEALLKQEWTETLAYAKGETTTSNTNKETTLLHHLIENIDLWSQNDPDNAEAYVQGFLDANVFPLYRNMSDGNQEDMALVLNAKDTNGLTALHLAAKADYALVFESLIDAGANLFERALKSEADDDGDDRPQKNPLDVAVDNHNTKVAHVLCLLEISTTFSRRRFRFFGKKKQDMPVHGNLLHYAAKHNKPRLAHFLLNHAVQQATSGIVMSDETEPMENPVAYKTNALFKHLVFAQEEYSGNTALHYAVIHNHVEVFRMIAYLARSIRPRHEPRIISLKDQKKLYKHVKNNDGLSIREAINRYEGDKHLDVLAALHLTAGHFAGPIGQAYENYKCYTAETILKRKNCLLNIDDYADELTGDGSWDEKESLGSKTCSALKINVGIPLRKSLETGGNAVILVTLVAPVLLIFAACNSYNDLDIKGTIATIFAGPTLGRAVPADDDASSLPSVEEAKEAFVSDNEEDIWN